MPARRFFALMKAKNKIECVQAMDRLDEALVGSNNVNMKWYEGLREKHELRLMALNPVKEVVEQKILHTDDEIKQTQVVLLELFRQRKQLMGYGR